MAEVLSEILGDQGTRKMPASVGGALLPRSKQDGNIDDDRHRGWHRGRRMEFDQGGTWCSLTDHRTAQDRPCDPRNQGGI